MMANLYDILAEAEGGKAMAMLGREYGLTPKQTQAAVTALLPAISSGLKQSTETPEGLGNLLGMMGYQRDLQAMHSDPKVAFAEEGRAAGNDILSVIFGSPDVSRAVADQAQKFSGIDAGILKKLLPVLAGILASGLMGGKSGQAAPQAPAAPQPGGGGLGDILGQIFGREMSGSPGSYPGPQQAPIPGGQPYPAPTSPGGPAAPGSDLLGYILREIEKGLREGRIKPVIIEGGPFQIPMPGGQGGQVQMPSPGGQGGPYQAPMPGGQGGPYQAPMPGGQAGPAPSGPQAPGGDVLGQILRDLLGGAMGGGPARAPQRPGQSPELKDLSDMSKQLGVMGGAGAAVFGDRFEVGREVEQDHLDNIQGVFDRFFGAQRR
jgi:hypothetical protein